MLHGNNWGRGAVEESTNQSPFRSFRAAIRALIFPWGVIIFTNMLYWLPSIYNIRWDPYDIDAINDHFSISGLEWGDLRNLCPA